MNRVFLLASALVLLPTTGCEDKAAKSSSDDDAGESSKKKKKSKKTKKTDDVKPEVFEDCADAKGGGYTTSSKTSEAKNTIGAIARGAAAAYEREVALPEDALPDAPSHKLCTSATPVPAKGPPSGTKYQPSATDGEDFESGDAESGWRCLKFALSQPHYFQYGYNAGSGYKSTAHGLPDPGPDGFEAWAMGDLDGDGRPSLYVTTGKIDNTTQQLKRSTKMSCVDPFE